MQDGAHGIVGGDDHGGDHRLFDLGDFAGRGKLRGIIHLQHFAHSGGDAIAHAGRGGDQVDAELALQAFLHDLHVQQAEEAAAEAEAQRDGVLRLVEERGVIELQLAQRVAQCLVVMRLHRKKAGEDHGLDGFKAGKRRGRARRVDDGVADARVGHALDIGDDEANVAGGQLFQDHRFGRERAEALHLKDFVVGNKANLLMRTQTAVHDAHQHHGAAIGVEPGVEDQRAKGRVHQTGRSGNPRDDSLQHFLHAQPAFRADGQRVGGGNRQHAFDLRFHFFGLRGGQVDFVDHRNDGQIVLRGQECVGHGLRFDALAGVHDEQRAFAGRKRARDFVGKIDVTGSIDQVELVFLAVVGAVMQADALGLDGDAALLFQIHGIEDLRGHFALGERAGKFEQAVGQRGLAVVDMRDDAEVADETGIHVDVLSLRGAVAPRIKGALRTLSLPHLGASGQTALRDVLLEA